MYATNAQGISVWLRVSVLGRSGIEELGMMLRGMKTAFFSPGTSLSYSHEMAKQEFHIGDHLRYL